MDINITDQPISVTVPNNVIKFLAKAKEIAKMTTGNICIHQRHLFAAMLLKRNNHPIMKSFFSGKEAQITSFVKEYFFQWDRGLSLGDNRQNKKWQELARKITGENLLEENIKFEKDDDFASHLGDDLSEELSEDEIAKIVKRKHQWILNKRALNNEVRKPGKPKEYVSGEAFSYLGRNYRLKVIRGNSKSVQCKLGRFYVEVPKNADDTLIRDLLVDWYKEHALKKFKQRVKRYADLLDITPTSIKTGDFKRQWGSCYQDKSIVLN